MYKVERRGRSKITTITSEHSESVFHDIDNLNKKRADEAEDNYEKVFITIRDTLKNSEEYCCDEEGDRLSLTQNITDALRKTCLIRREGA
jgi:hypothetical protein